MPRRSRSREFVRRIFLGIILLVASIWVISPIYIAFLSSIKTHMQTFEPTFIPFLQFQPTLNNWTEDLATKGRDFLLASTNGIIVAGTSTAVVLIVGTFAGYSLARFQYQKWKNKDIIFWILTLRMLPPVAIAIPFFVIIYNLGLLDTNLALIIAHSLLNLPFGALLMRASFRDIPVDIEESALVDGCSQFSALVRIAIPLALPALAATALLSFAFSWNEFLFAYTLTYVKAFTMPVVIAGATGSTRGIEFWFIGTRGIIAIVPPMVIALLAYRYIVRGLTFGAVKG